MWNVSPASPMEKFTHSTEGGRRLNPQMAKVVAGQVATLPVDQVVREFLARVGGKAQKSGPGFYTAGQDRQ